MIDVHNHPPLKGWLFNRDLWKNGYSSSFFNPFSSRTNFPLLEEGGFGVIWATHYVPELGLLNDSFIVRWLAKVLWKYSKLTNGSPFSRLEKMMNQLEKTVNEKSGRAEIARSMEDVDRILDENKIALVHAVEGGHVLEKDLSRLKELAQRGVVSLTLSHFYPNGIASHVDGVPDSIFLKKISSFDFFKEEQEPLTEFGKNVLDKMIELGILADLTHSSPDARSEIYKYLPVSVPLIATHVGLHKFQPKPMNFTDDELIEIAQRDGAIGVIFYNYWLDSDDSSEILPALWRTVKHIYEVTGSWSNIMIGTDFDGFTEPPKGIKDVSQIGKFTKMLIDRGVPDKAIKKILGGNCMRIMRKNWQTQTSATKEL